MARVKGDPGCTRCPLHQGAQSVCLMGQGPVPSKAMVVGEAPGFREDDINKPFQGRSGEYLEEALERVGLDRSELYISNAVKCRPADNRTPRIREIRACKSWLEKELRIVKPRYVLLLGNVALKSVGINPAKITQVRGKRFKLNGHTFFPTYHPAACIRRSGKRGNKFAPQFAADIENFAKMVRGVKEKTPANIQAVRTVDDFNDMLEELRRESITSFDLETDRLSPFEEGARINLVGIGMSKTQWIIPMAWPGFRLFKSFESQKMAMQLIADELQNTRVTTQFGKFDILWSKVIYGVDVKIDFDVGLASYQLDENTPNNLNFLSSSICGARNYDIPLHQKQGHGISYKKFAKYCGLDLYYTRLLRFHFKPKLRADPLLWKFYSKVLIPAFNTYRDIERTGMYVDMERLQKTEFTLMDGRGDTHQVLNAFGTHVNWASPKQVQKIFFEQLNFKILDRTKTGQPSTNESVLKRLAKPKKKRLKLTTVATRETHNPRTFFPGTKVVLFNGFKHEIPQALLDRRGFTKLLEFCKSWREKAVDNRIHPAYKFITVTGRTSCEKPNLQQTPRDKRLRPCLIAPPGWCFIEPDYSQIELRLAAMAANETTMKTIFQTGGNIHENTATQIMGVSPDDLTEEQYKKAKPVNFGFLYGMGWKKFIIYSRDNYGLVFTPHQAQEYREGYFNTYSRLRSWHARQRRIVRNLEQVRNMLGRVRHLPDIHSGDDRLEHAAERQAINSPIQGLGSDIKLCAAIQLNESFSRKELRLCGDVHDSLPLIIREGSEAEILPEVKRIMESPRIIRELGVRFTIPIVVDIKVGPWGEGELWTMDL